MMRSDFSSVPVSRSWLALFLAATLPLAACSDKTSAQADAAAAQPAAAPSTQAASVAPTAPTVTTNTMPAAPSASAQGVAGAAPRMVTLHVQGVSPLGLTVRVKRVEMEPDATVLSVSTSFSSTATNYVNLADGDTYLLDGQGNKIMIKRPDDNRYLRITNGQTLEGELVFLGQIPAGTRQVELVLNDGHAPDDTSGPGLKLVLPLAAGG